MNDKSTYYLIRGKTLAKREKTDGSYSDYIFTNGEWSDDKEHLVSDHLMGYDPTEPPGSPYGIFNTDIMDQIETISDEEAEKIMKGVSS